jgi:hypothetical protein
VTFGKLINVHCKAVNVEFGGGTEENNKGILAENSSPILITVLKSRRMKCLEKYHMSL